MFVSHKKMSINAEASTGEFRLMRLRLKSLYKDVTSLEKGEMDKRARVELASHIRAEMCAVALHANTLASCTESACSAHPTLMCEDGCGTDRIEALESAKALVAGLEPLIPTPIGVGTFGSVYASSVDGTPVAVKRIPKKAPKLKKKSTPEQILTRDIIWNNTAAREKHALQHLRDHPNIVKLISHSQDPMASTIIMELCECSLEDVRGSLDEHEIKFLVYGALRGLQHAHKLGVTHMDVKSNNLLIGANGEVRVSDWGSASSKELGIMPERDMVTMGYRPPEILLGQKTDDPAVDIWALGCVFFELFYKERPVGAMDAYGDQEIMFRQELVLMGVPSPRLQKKWSKLLRGPKLLPGALTLIKDNPKGTFDVMFAAIPSDVRACIRLFLALDPVERIRNV